MGYLQLSFFVREHNVIPNKDTDLIPFYTRFIYAMRIWMILIDEIE